MSAVLRTAHVWVDRRRLRATFQLRDSLGSPLVDVRTIGAVRLLVAPLGAATALEADCYTGQLDLASAYYTGWCYLAPSDIEDSWFDSSAEAIVSLVLQVRRPCPSRTAN